MRNNTDPHGSFIWVGSQSGRTALVDKTPKIFWFFSIYFTQENKDDHKIWLQHAFNSNKGFHLSFNKEEKNKSRRRRQININNICVIKTQPLTYRLFSSIAATESVLRCHIAMVTREVRGWSPDCRGSTRWCLGPRCGGQSWEMAQFPTPAALAGQPRCQIQTFGQVYTEPAAFLHQSESSTVSWHDNRQVDGAATYWRHDSPVPLSSLPLGASSDSS